MTKKRSGIPCGLALLSASLVAFACILTIAPAAQAAASCAYASVTRTATVTLGSGDTTWIDRQPAAEGTAIEVDHVACGVATVNNTDTIVVNGSSGNESVTVNLGDGALAPGQTPEDTGASEIELIIGLDEGYDTLRIEGSSSGDNYRLGTNGANLNGDDDADLGMADVESVAVSGNGGNDILSAAGGLGTGSPFATGVSFSGGSGNDTLTGGAGADWFDSGDSLDGADTMSGGAGGDTATYQQRTSPVQITSADGLANDGEAGENDLVCADVESLWGGSASDTLTGSSGNDSLYGQEGADSLYGGGGNDGISGGAGNDHLYGGAGNDRFNEDSAANGADVMAGGAGTDRANYAFRVNPVTLTLADGLANDGEAGEGDLVRADVEDVTGGHGDDTITGSSVANALSGGGGADTIYAGDGNDALEGDDGSDTLYGGTGGDLFYEGASANGSDTFVGSSGIDTLSYQSRSGALTIALDDGLANDGEAGEHDLARVDIENVYGGAGNDTISGNSVGNMLHGGAGNDALYGGGGSDSLYCDGGNDALYGGADDDVLFAQDGLADTLNGGSGTDQAGAYDVGLDTLISIP